MAILTKIELDEARELGHRFGKEVVAMRGILAGSVNSNFELDTASGERLFLRVYEEQTVETAGREAALLTELAHRGVPTGEPLRLTGGDAFIAELRGKPAALFPFVDGEVLCQKRVTPPIAREVGRALGTIHRANAGGDLERWVGPSRFGRDALAARLRGLPKEGLSPDVVGARDRVEAYLQEEPARPGLMGVIHGDLFRDNILWRNGHLASVLDFESASHGSVAFDLMVTILAWCFDDVLEAELARAMTSGYLEVAALSETDRALLARDLFPEARFACARFMTTRITDFELRPRGTGVYKDFRRFVARMDAIERLGTGGLASFLHPGGFAKEPSED